MKISFKQHGRLLAGYLRPQWPRVLLLAALILGHIGLQLVNPQIVRTFIDTAQAGGALGRLTGAALLFLGVAVAGQAVSLAVAYLGQNVAWTATNALRLDLTLHCLRLDMPFHKAHAPGELIERIDGDVSELANFFSQLVIRLLGNGLLVLGVVLLLFREDWRVGLAAAMYILLTVALLRRVQTLASQAWNDSRQAHAELMGFLGERLAGTEDIRANGAEPYVMRQLHQLMRVLLQRGRRAPLMGSLTFILGYSAFMLVVITTLGIGAVLFLRGLVTIGTVYLLLSYVNKLYEPLQEVQRQIAALQQSAASVGRVSELLQARPRVVESVRAVLPPGPLGVAFEGVSFHYDNRGAGGNGWDAPGTGAASNGGTPTGRGLRALPTGRGLRAMGGTPPRRGRRALPPGWGRRAMGGTPPGRGLRALPPGWGWRALGGDAPGTGATPPRIGLWGLLAVLAGVHVARMVAFFAKTYGEETFRYVAQALLRKNIVAGVLRRPGAQALPVSPGDAINRLQDDVAEVADFPTWLPHVLGQVSAAVVAAAIMFTIHPTITLVTVVPLIATFIVGRYTMRYLVRYWRTSRETTGAVTGFLGEVLDAVQAVKIADAETDVIAHFHTLNEARRKADLKNSLFLQLLQGVWANIGDLGFAIVLLLSARAVQTGTFTVGDFVLFTSYVWLVMDGPEVIGGFVADYRNQAVSIDRMLELQPDAPPETLVTRDVIPSAARNLGTDVLINPLETLEARGLTYRYPDSDKGIVDVDLRLERGSFTVVTGRIGAGKTTLLRVLLGLLPRDAGEVRWNGRPVDDLAVFFQPPRSACTPQVPLLFSESLRDNILMGLPDEAGLRFLATLGVARFLAGLGMTGWRSGQRCWSGTWRSWKMAWIRSSAPRGSGFRAGRCSARRRRACSSASRSCWCLTICPARSTWRRSRRCGSGCSPAGAARESLLRAWWSPTAGLRCAAPSASSSSRMAG